MRHSAFTVYTITESATYYKHISKRGKADIKNVISKALFDDAVLT
jgi:hypothetical protein